jgi:uncharacterized membrane protein
MKLSRSEAVVIVIVLLFFVVSGYVYPQLPENIASHWNAAGEADGYMSRLWGLFFLPVVFLVIASVLLVLPRTGLLRNRIENFRKEYYGFLTVFTAFFFYVHLLTIFWNLGYSFNMLRLLAPAIAVLIYFSGMLMSGVKMNRFFGIRTAWTLSSEKVWERTHSFGGRLFKVAAAVCFLGVVFPGAALALILAPIILASATAVLYSYIEYRKETAHSQPGQD